MCGEEDTETWRHDSLKTHFIADTPLAEEPDKSGDYD